MNRDAIDCRAARIMRVGLLLALLLQSTAVLADEVSVGAAADRVFGLWAGAGAIVQIYPAAPGLLGGKVVALKQPMFKQDDKGPVGEPVTDINNPDPALRDSPIIGLEVLSNYRRKGKKWKGKVYNPKNGKTYSSNMRVAADGELLVRGYIGAPLFGRTARFVPVSRCTKSILRMLHSAQLPGCESQRPAKRP